MQHCADKRLTKCKVSTIALATFWTMNNSLIKFSSTAEHTLHMLLLQESPQNPSPQQTEWPLYLCTISQKHINITICTVHTRYSNSSTISMTIIINIIIIIFIQLIFVVTLSIFFTGLCVIRLIGWLITKWNLGLLLIWFSFAMHVRVSHADTLYKPHLKLGGLCVK